MAEIIGVGGTINPQTDCRHVWVANSGRGGEPEFRPAAIVAGDTPVMHVVCRACHVRTWFSRAQWAALSVEGETRAQRRRRIREARRIQEKEERDRERLIERRRREYERAGGTFWNGEPAECRQVVVRVGHSERPTWWCAELEGQLRRAVEVKYAGQVFFLDDQEGGGWAKVTLGRGSPGYAHGQLPDDSEVVEEASP